MEICFFIGWVLLAAAASMFAESYRRSTFGWFVFAFLLSPLIAFIYLLVLGPVRVRDPRWWYLRAGVPEITAEQVAQAATIRQGDRNLKTMLMCGGLLALVFLALKLIASYGL